MELAIRALNGPNYCQSYEILHKKYVLFDQLKVQKIPYIFWVSEKVYYTMLINYVSILYNCGANVCEFISTSPISFLHFGYK